MPEEQKTLSNYSNSSRKSIDEEWKLLSPEEKLLTTSYLRKRGYKRKEVAEILNVSQRTITRHSREETKIIYYRQSKYQERESKKIESLEEQEKELKDERLTDIKTKIIKNYSDSTFTKYTSKSVRTYFRYGYYNPDNSKNERISRVISVAGHYSLRYMIKKSGMLNFIDRIEYNWGGGWLYKVYKRGSFNSPLIELP